jgi:hypothetical protein
MSDCRYANELWEARISKVEGLHRGKCSAVFAQEIAFRRV